MRTSTRLLLGSTLSALAFFSASVSAQYVGPSANATAYHSVADVLSNPVDDALVTFEGYLVKKIGKEKYIFSDGKSQIRVEIDDKYFPPSPINEKTKVLIRGEVDREILRDPEIDVKYIQLVN